MAGSLEFGVDADGFERVTFDLATEPTIEPARFDVRDVERINFVYGPGRRFGETAPTWITCDREDFPRNIGHLCAGPPGCPAVPCLALGGMQPLFERGGIEVLMDRLREFIRDAKTGTLMADGWEPVPFPVDQTFQFGGDRAALLPGACPREPGGPLRRPRRGDQHRSRRAGARQPVPAGHPV
ncbi:MAG: hypothetical protein WDN44_09225 [Sphingomonas sp.]